MKSCLEGFIFIFPSHLPAFLLLALTSPAGACLCLVFVADIPGRIISVFWGICTSPNIEVSESKNFSAVYINTSFSTPGVREDLCSPDSVLVLSNTAIPPRCSMTQEMGRGTRGRLRRPSWSTLAVHWSAKAFQFRQNEQKAGCRLPKYPC